MVLLEQSAVFEEGFAEIEVVPDFAGRFSGLDTYRIEVFADELSHLVRDRWLQKYSTGFSSGAYGGRYSMVSQFDWPAIQS